jgi:copper oxidase (laccase) domain-containing protein
MDSYPPSFVLPLLEEIPFLEAYLIKRIPGLALPLHREEALQAQMPLFQKIVQQLLPRAAVFCCAQEVHGSEIAIIKHAPKKQNGRCEFIPNVDGLITDDSNLVLGITVADCAPVWIVDPKRQAVAIVHSGKRGTEAGIVPKAIRLLQTNFGSEPRDLIVTIGPCIRPPCYEIDFAKTIREQASQAGVEEIRDEEICTACHLDDYYSYRREKGVTGHMLAIVMKRTAAESMNEK